MKRRQLLLGLGVTASAGVALGTGAFSNASAQRQMSVRVADDASGLLSLKPTGGPNGAYVDGSGDQVVVGLGDGDAGLTERAQYQFHDTLAVGNQGTQQLYVWVTVSSAAFGDDALYAYRGDDAGTQLSETNAVALGVGDSLSVGFAVDTTGIETDTYEPTLTVHAAAEPPAGDAPEDPEEPAEPTEFVDELVFDSTASLLAEGTAAPGGEFGYLADEHVAVAAESTAASTDADGNGDAVSYPDSEDLPLMGVDGTVVAFGFPFAQDDLTFGRFGNEEVLLNVLDEYAGSGTVLWDEGHGQFYDLASHSSFAGYAEDNGYTVDATSDLAGDLADANAAVVTSPADAFSNGELDALADFAADGGLVVLMDQSDFQNFDATDNLNAVAEGLDTVIRFNDNQVVDSQTNAGAEFAPVTSRFDTDAFPQLFAERPGLGVELSRGETYEVDVVSVADGDTADVAFPDQGGIEKTVRLLGVDTPETGDTTERIEEYEGITNEAALKDKAEGASAYADDLLAGETVTLSFDENEPLRGTYGRLLGYLELPNGDTYNRSVIEDGWARVYSSGFGSHDDYWDAEDSAQAAGDGIWALSGDVPEAGDEPVESLFFPEPVAVSGGDTVVASEDGDPLVAIDESTGVAAVGGPLVSEDFEPGEAGDGEPTNDGQQVYPFVANLVDALADGGLTGPVLFDGGHGQFNADSSLASEDVAYFQRYLEGQSPPGADGIALEGTNDLLDDAGPALLDGGDPAASALVVTTPTESFTDAEAAKVAEFADAGGAVVLVGTAANTDALSNFDPVVSELGTDAGFTTTPVEDATNNIGDPTLPATTNFTGSSDLFTAFTPSDGGGDATVGITDVSGGDEYVTVANPGGSEVSLTDWTLSDAAGATFTFPDIALGADETVVVTTNETPSGAAPAATYTENWDAGNVWNNGGDTATLADADGGVVDTYSY
jgi:endonuclease YncB( thermonuclease family)